MAVITEVAGLSGVHCTFFATVVKAIYAAGEENRWPQERFGLGLAIHLSICT